MATPTETIGVISDTHGLLRQEAIDALKGCSRIIHAGDVGRPEVLTQLRMVAPVIAVRGNVDTGAWAAALPRSKTVELEGHAIYIRHIVDEIDVVPSLDGISAVVYGHSHKPSVEHRGGVLYLNPGSAGPRRFTLPVAVARMSVVKGQLAAQIIELHVS